jgi:hypothetical protein
MPAPRRKRVVLAAGVGSRSGDALRLFAGFRQFLIDEAGFAPEDFLEATYAGRYVGGRWVGPAPYDETASTAPLAASVAHCAQALLWWARQQPRGVEWHLVGFSLGGLVLLEAAGLLHQRAPDSWGQHLRSLTTLSSPLNGCALGEFSWLGAVLGPGAVGAELCALGNDPRHRERIAALVARLRAAGVVVTTLVEADDAVVQPADGIVGPIDPSLIVPCRSQPDDPPGARYLGHGRIVNEPRVWKQLLAIIGPQVGFTGRPAGAGRGLVTPPPAEDVQRAREQHELKRRLGPPADGDGR